MPVRNTKGSIWSAVASYAGRRTGRLASRFDSMGLASKFYLLYILLLAVPVVVTAAVVASNYSDEARAKAMEQGMAGIRETKASVEKNTANCWHAVQLVTSNRAFLDVLSTRREYTTLELVEFQRNVLSNIDAIKYTNADFYAFNVYINNYNLYEFYPTIKFEDKIADTAWYKRLGGGKRAWFYCLGPIDGSDPADVFGLYSELKSQAKEHLGAIMVQIRSETFFGSPYGAPGEDRFMCVLGKDKSVHYNKASALAGKCLSSSGDAAGTLLSRMDAGGRGFVTSLGGYEVVVNYAYEPSLDAYLVNVTSMESVNRQVASVVLAAAAACVVILGFLSLATYSIVSVLLRKLHTTIALMRRVEQGELVVDIPDLGGDEAGELNSHFKDMLGRINELIHTVYMKQNAAREAELKSLHSQLNAHFIYNVLESIKMMAVLQYEYGIADAVTSLGRIMRYSMNWRKPYALLKDEIGNLSSYMKLMNLQREMPVDLVLDVPGELGECEVLKMILQPLAENAMVHALKQVREGGRLGVSAWRTGAGLAVAVEDNGCGMDAARLAEVNEALTREDGGGSIEGAGTGIGLVNIHDRLRLFYGRAYGLQVESAPAAGTRIVLNLPARREAGAAGER